MRLCRLFALAAAAVAVLGACTSTLQGQGAATTAAGPSGPSSTGQPANRFARTPVSTAIGDPVTLDFCAAIEAAATVGKGYTGRFADSQYVPGCATTVVPVGAGAHLTVSTFVASGTVPSSAAGRSTARVSGLTVYRFPYVADDGNCERDVVTTGVTVKIISAARKSADQPSATVTCEVTSAILARLAPAMASRSLPALAVATPSLTSLDGCSIAKAAGLESLSLLVGGSYTPDDLGVGCGVTGKASMYIDPVIMATDIDPDGVPVQVSRHSLWADKSNGATFCSFTSVQGRTSNGRYEALTAVTTPAGTDPMPAGACDQTRQALVRYLDTAGLK